MIDSLPIGNPKQEPQLLAERVFAWCVGREEEGQKPIDALQSACDNDLICSSELLAIYSFVVLAADADKRLVEKLDELSAITDIPEDFVPFPKGIAGIAEGKFQKLSANEILSSPPPEIASAVADEVIAYLVRHRLMRRRRLTGLKVGVFQHPVDCALQGTIKALPSIIPLMEKIVDLRGQYAEVLLSGRAILVEQNAALDPVFECFQEACETLDVIPMPKLFIEQGPLSNATRTIGVSDPCVVVTSVALSLLTRDELLFTLGHELGHIKAGHLLYHATADVIRDSANLASDITLGLSSLLTDSTITPLMAAWLRRAELTADRAGFLACQDKEVALRAILKIAGYPPALYRQLHSRTIVEQANRLREMLTGSALNRFYKLNQLWTSQQPFPMLRAYELLDWMQDGFPFEVLEMTEAQLDLVQSWHSEDPILAEFIYQIIRTTSEWAVQRYSLRIKVCRRLVRQMLLEKQTARGTDLARILQLSIILEKVASDAITYTIVALVHENGKALKIRIPIDRSESWDDVPKQYRDDFIRSGDSIIEYNLYTL